jgi:demethylspheroidene O-methyltransferase
MSLADRYLAIRDRWLSSPRFQRWAAAFPLTRGTARTRARALFDLCAGFVYSQILFACVRLHLFDLLAVGPLTAPDIAEALRLPLDSTERLLEAAVSLKLVDARSGSRFGLGALGAAMVGNGAVKAMVEHHPLFYADMTDPVRLLRREGRATELGRYWAYAESAEPAALPSAAVADYTSLMGRSLPLVADEILDAYPLHKHRCLLDVGGGDGSFLMAAGRRCPDLQLVLMDLPAVASCAERRFAEAGLQSRARAVGGNFHDDELPHIADVISLVRVVHDHDDAAVIRLLRAAHRALPDHGVLLIAEPMKQASGAAPVGAAYFGFYLLAMGSGRARSAAELEALLVTAGFGSIQSLATRQPLQSGLVVATKRPQQVFH